LAECSFLIRAREEFALRTLKLWWLRKVPEEALWLMQSERVPRLWHLLGGEASVILIPRPVAGRRMVKSRVRRRQTKAAAKRGAGPVKGRRKSGRTVQLPGHLREFAVGDAAFQSAGIEMLSTPHSSVDWATKHAKLSAEGLCTQWAKGFSSQWYLP
jgi:hypothetical protein